MGSFQVRCPVCGGGSKRVKDQWLTQENEMVYQCVSTEHPQCGHVGLFLLKRDERQEIPEETGRVQRSEKINAFCKLLYIEPPKHYLRYYLEFVRTISPAGMRPIHDENHPGLFFVELDQAVAKPSMKSPDGGLPAEGADD